MRIIDMKLKTKVFGMTFSLIILIFILLGFTFYKVQKKNLIEETDERMLSQLNDIYSILDMQVKAKQEAVNISLNLAHSILNDFGEIVQESEYITVTGTNQISENSKSYKIPVWTLNNKQLYKNYEIVDLIKERSVETATIFQKIEDGYLRISTNVMKNDGKRAVGTFIPNSSEVIKTVESGKTYYGRAFVVNDWYLTAYEPIFINNKVQGILYVGVKEKDYSFLKNLFANKKYYQEGYPFIVDKEGTFVIHPTKEGENFANANFFQQLKSAKTSDYKSRYKWPENNDGKWKQQYFKYFEPYESYVCVSVYENDIYSSIISLMKVLIVSVLISIILLSVGLVIILNPLLRGIKDIETVASKISKGDLNTSISINKTDEIGLTASSLQKMIENLKTIINNINEKAEDITSVSVQLKSSSQEVSQSANEQASSAEEISSSVEQMAVSNKNNADNAKQTEHIAKTVANDIKNCIKATNSSVDSMKNIAEKITIVNDIAFQTNILALNAAVEAARAGEHGKGFAVVAAEVRKLAERSKLAAEEIDELSRSGVSISKEAGEKLLNIAPEIERNAKLVQEISSSSQEQDSGIGQVNNALQQLNSTTQENAASAEELASSSEELAKFAELLKNTIGFFQLNGKNSNNFKNNGGNVSKLLNNIKYTNTDIDNSIISHSN